MTVFLQHYEHALFITQGDYERHASIKEKKYQQGIKAGAHVQRRTAFPY